MAKRKTVVAAPSEDGTGVIAPEPPKSDVWVMAERKQIRVAEKRTADGGVVSIQYVTKIFSPGDVAPPGHEGRPYTRKAGGVQE